MEDFSYLPDKKPAPNLGSGAFLGEGVTPSENSPLSLQGVNLPDKHNELESAYRDVLDVQPDHAAKVMGLAKKVNEPEPFVAKNLDKIERAANTPPTTFFEEFEKSAPKAAAILKERKMMAAAKDDFDSLGQFESLVTQFSTGWQKGNLQSRLAELYSERLKETRETGVLSSKHEAEIRKLEKDLEPLSAIDARVSQNFHPLYQTAAQLPNMTRAFVRVGAGESPTEAVGPATAGAAAGAATGAGVGAVFGGAGAAPGAMVGARLGVLGGLPIHAYQLEAGLAFRDYSALKDRAGNPINPQAAASAAHTVGLVNAALESASDVLLLKGASVIGKAAGNASAGAVAKGLSRLKIPGGEKLAEMLTANSKVFEGMTISRAIREAAKMMVAQTGTELVTEYAQEISTGLGQEAAMTNSGQKFSDRKTFGEIAESATGVLSPTFQAMLIPGFAVGGAHIYNSTQAIKHAEEAKQFYQAMGDTAQSSKLRERLPEAHRQFVEQVTQNSPLKSLYISVGDFETYFQSKNTDPEAAAAELGVSAQMQTAKENGLDIEIPLSTWTEKVVGTEHHQGLADDIKFSPEDLTARQAKERTEEVNQLVETELAQAEEAMKQDQAKKAGFDLVYNDMRQRLSSAPPKAQMTPKEEKAWQKQIEGSAKTWAAHAVAESSRRGISVDEYWDSTRKPDIISEARPYRQSVLERIQGEIQMGELQQGGLMRDQEGYVTGAFGRSSTFPEWFKNKGFTKEESLKVIEKYMAGKELTEKQKELLDQLYRESGYAAGTSVVAEENAPFLQVANAEEFFQSANDQAGGQREMVPAFYSKLTRTVEEKMGGSATVEQVNGMLREVKPEERKWLGLDEFLKGKEKLSKQELLDFLRASALEIQEVTKSDDGEVSQDRLAEIATSLENEYRNSTDAIRKTRDALVDQVFKDVKNTDAALRLVKSVGSASADRMDQAIETLKDEAPNADPSAYTAAVKRSREAYDAWQRAREQFNAGEKGATKFAQYTLPGGENYREVLFTLPAKKDNTVSERMDEIERILTQTSGPVVERDALRAEYSRLAQTKKDRTHTDYHSSHWEEKNVLAHTRLSDRVDVDGKKVLHIEEIQSDWHQAGRKKGYMGDVKEEPLLPPGWKVAEKTSDHFELYDEQDEYRGINRPGESRAEFLHRILNRPDAGVAVPDAPFKKTWHEFVLKRLIRYAAENGYDKIAWTPGEAQAERYDLGKQVSKIEAASSGSKGGHTVVVYGKDGEIVQSMTHATPEQIEGVLGKDLAQRITSTPEGQVIEGDGLRIGGEGMKGFYDKMIPDFLNKYTKKWGGKVGETVLPGEETKRNALIVERDGKFALVSLDGTIGTFESKTEAEAALAEFDKNAIEQGTGVKLHSLDITPQMRDAVLFEGQTLFQMRQDEQLVDRSGLKKTEVKTVEPKTHVKFKGDDFGSANHRPGEFVNADTKQTISVNADTRRKAISFAKTSLTHKENRTKARQHLEALQHMGDLVKEAVLISESRDTKDRPGHWRYFFAPLRMEGKDFLVKLEVAEGTSGLHVHNYVLVDPRGLVPQSDQSQLVPGSREATSSPRESNPPGPGNSPESGSKEATSSPSGTRPISDFMRLVNAARNRYSFFQDEETPRGSVQFAPEAVVISLFKEADASTFLHESAHVWLKEMFDYVKANENNLTEEYSRNWLAVSKWLGISLEQDKLTVDQQETFARGFEAYLREGKSPVEALRRVFRTFRLWLTRIYRNAGSLNVEMSDEVRAIMDRMVATEDEIALAHREVGYQPMPVDIEDLPEEVKARMKTLQEEAHEEAISTLLKRQMDELRTDNREFVETQRVRIEAEVTEQVHAMPIYQIMADIKEKKKKSAVTLARAMVQGKLDEEGVALFDSIADLAGFSSGDELAKIIIATTPEKERVQQIVRQRMTEFSDLRNTRAIRDEALKAVHNEKAMELMALEREILNDLIEGTVVNEEAKKRKTAEARVEAAAAREKAKESIEKLKVRVAISSTPFFTAERNWAKKAAVAISKKELEAARTFKQQQLANHSLAVESLKAEKRVEKWVNFFQDLRSRKMETFKKEEHFFQVASLLSKLGFARRDFDPNLKRETLSQWAERMNAITNVVNLPDWILKEEEKVLNYKEMTVEQLEEAYNALKNIVKVATMERRAIAIANGAEIDSIIKDLEFAANLNIKAEDRHKFEMEPEKFDDAKRLGKKYLLSITKVQTLLKKLDGFRDNGKWFQIFWESSYNAANHESQFMDLANRGLERVWSVYSEKEREEMINKRIFYPELGTSATKIRLIMMALNLGNADNQQRLFDTRPVGIEEATRWDGDVIMQVLQKNLSERDWRFVQTVWDLLEEFWPPIAKMHKDLTGFAPRKVEAVPFNVITQEGKQLTLRGGYFPLKEDPRANVRAEIREQLEAPLYSEQNPGWIAATKTGHTKARAQEAFYSVSLDVTLIYRHLRDVIHDLAFRPTIIDLRRIVDDSEFQGMTRKAIGPEGYAMLREWVASVASGNVQERPASEVWEKMVASLRRRSTIAMLMFKTSVILQNFSNPFLYPGAVEGFGVKESLHAFFVRGVLDYLPKAMFNWKAQKEIKDFVYSKSAFMRDKATNPDFSLAETHAKLFGKDSKIQEFATGLMAGSDELSAIPMWLEAYNHALDHRFMEDEEAVKYADTLIDRVLGSGRKYDAAQIQRGGELARSLSMFYTFLNTEFNRWASEYGKAQFDPKYLPTFLGFMASRLLFFVPVSAMLSGKGPKEDDDKLKWWLKEIMSYPFQLFPGVREMSSVAWDHALGMKSFGYKPSPAVGAIEAGLFTVQTGSKLVRGEGELQPFLEASTKSAAFLFPYPDQFNSWMWNSYDYFTKGMEPKLSDLYRRRPKRER